MNVVPVNRSLPVVPAASTVGPARPLAQPEAAAPALSLSQVATPTFRVLQGGGGFPASSTPSFVIPANAAGFLRLYAALEAIAVEHVYPAPIFSFQA